MCKELLTNKFYIFFIFEFRCVNICFTSETYNFRLVWYKFLNYVLQVVTSKSTHYLHQKCLLCRSRVIEKNNTQCTFASNLFTNYWFIFENRTSLNATKQVYNHQKNLNLKTTLRLTEVSVWRQS